MGESLIDSINDQAGTMKEEDLKTMVEKVEEDMADYAKRLESFLEDNDATILLTETEISEEEVTQIHQIQTPAQSGWRMFRPNANLKPSFLEKDSSALDVKHFNQMLKSYIMDGFQGEPMVKSIPIHLQPLVEATWWQSLVQRGVEENKSLDQVIELIEAESEARNPLHQRRMELLRVRKSGSHSDYLYQIEQHGQLIDFPSLTLDSLVSHLFLEQCDQDMGKICQEILAKEPGGNLQLLRTEVKRAEGSVWYKGNKHSAKRTDDRFCSECDANSH